MATVTINGRTLPPVIAAPFRIDVTDSLRPGPNMFKVTVANVPQNGMIDTGNPAFKKLKPVAAGWVGAGRLEASR